MRILIFPCSYTCRNTGDVAMMQIAISRLRNLWPAASFQIPTHDPVALRRYCGDVQPLRYGEWFSDHYLAGRLHRVVPAAVSRALVDLKVRIRRRSPALHEHAIRLKLRLRGEDPAAFVDMLRAEREADAVVVTGAGGLCDIFPSFTLNVLRTLEAAIRRGQPTAMFSQGLGPLHREDLRVRARSVLPRVSLIALRERCSGPALLRELGVDPERTIVSGDDAIEVAYSERSERLGDGIGVNVRTGSAADIGEEFIGTLRPIVQEFARKTGAPLIPLPIAWQHDWDGENIARLVAGFDRVECPEENLDTTVGICRQIGHCRVVVVGAYHAAVFAMAQGIPSVALAKSEYYLDKFRGLADIFGLGCQVVRLGEPGIEQRLRDALETAWAASTGIRDRLRRAASEQIQNSRAAYSRFGEIASCRVRSLASLAGPSRDARVQRLARGLRE